jgi:hypothetical protein
MKNLGMGEVRYPNAVGIATKYEVRFLDVGGRKGVKSLK